MLGVIDSFEKLEIVCRTARHRDATWSLTRIASELHLPAESVEQSLRELIAAGLLDRDGEGAVRYAPASADVDGEVQLLAKLYEEDTLLVVRAISQRAMERIRVSTAHRFADAFLVRRRKPEEPHDG